ncbi:MAG TPA: restriction endonuclease subunit S [bacterium]|nr:restriction endonuclease subunit S [bacterium]
MVAPLHKEEELQTSVEVSQEDLQWSTVSLLSDVLTRRNKKVRLEASVFGIEGRHAREVLKQNKWPRNQLVGDTGLATAYYPSRFSRVYQEDKTYPFITPKQIEDIKPEPKGYLSKLCEVDLKGLMPSSGEVLVTRSGSVGRCAYVNKTLEEYAVSDDVIRLHAYQKCDSGYIYAFLRTKIGQTLVTTNQYGAVIKHIEPEHLENIPIPVPPNELKKKIHDLIVHSYELRDESNALLDEAESLLYKALNLPPIDKLKPAYLTDSGLRSYPVKLSEFDSRLDGSYHVPIINEILNVLQKEAAEVTNVGNPRISTKVILPNRFTRVYVEEGQGTVFFGHKQIFQVDPSDKKYLSVAYHRNKLENELVLKENMVLISRSGTIGKVMLTPKHWERWVINEHVIRVVPADNEIAGYLSVFLNSDYGWTLVTRFTYGMNVDEIDDMQVSRVPVPLLKDIEMQKHINNLALEANKMRTKAYYAEQKAIQITNEEVIYNAR